MQDDSDEMRDDSDETRETRDSEEREVIVKQNLLTMASNSSWFRCGTKSEEGTRFLVLRTT